MSDSLLPPNATDLELAVEKVLSRPDQIPILIDTLWNPADAPENTLPWLAWALSVDEWSSGWSVETKRRVIASSVETHRSKGTLEAMKTALAALGYSIRITEWFEANPPMPPYTFAIYVDNENELSADIDESIRRIVYATKPARSHLSGVVLMTVTVPHNHILSTTLVGDVVTIYPG